MTSENETYFIYRLHITIQIKIFWQTNISCELSVVKEPFPTVQQTILFS